MVLRAAAATTATVTNTVASDDDSSHGPDGYSMNKSLAELTDRYDGFILDQFGVMHNGAAPLAGAVDCVRELRARGKRLAILSNSSALGPTTMGRLERLGFRPADFCGAVTSGEEAARFVRRRYVAPAPDRPVRALFLTWDAPQTPAAFLKACGPTVVATDRVEEADLVLLHGSQVLRGEPGADGEARLTPLGFFESGDPARLEPLLEACRRRRLELVCCNPDYVSIAPDGAVRHMPGTIADLYQHRLGGTVHSFGKPHRRHFEACLALLGLPRDRVAHVGDSLPHDVRGAAGAGLASVFVAGGVHRAALGVERDGDMPDAAALDALFAAQRQIPTHVVPMFQF